MNLNKNIEIMNLYEVYGNLLTEKQRQIFSLYVENDLSLAEVSGLLNISRQAVKYALDNAIKSMQEYEKKLSFLQKIGTIKYRLKELQSFSKDKNIVDEIDKLLEDI